MQAKYLAAIHEAGHAAVVRHFRGLASIEIHRNRSGNFEEREWLGSCHVLHLPGSNTSVPDDRSECVGLAGYVAEQIARGDEDPVGIWEAFKYAVIDGEISPTDLALIGDVDALGDSITERVLKMLKDSWHDIELEASRLVDATREYPNG